MDFKFESYNSDTRINKSTGKEEVIGFENIPLDDKWENLSTKQRAEIILKADRICRWQVPAEERDVLLDKMNSFASQVGFKSTATANPHKTVANAFNVFCNRKPSNMVSYDAIADSLQDDELLKLLAMGQR
tara:strand:- start:60 stop:452 length:393 start_codon:yes stop_codon:yes gene_type:complete